MVSPRRALTAAQPVIIAGAFALLGLLLRSQWSELRAHDWRLRPAWLFASGALIVAGWLLEIRMWQQLLGRLHRGLAYPTAVGIWFASAVVRYVPGNIWQPLSLVARCRLQGVRPEATLASLSLFHVTHLLAVGPIVVLYLATSGSTSAVAAWTGAFSPWWTLLVALPIIYFVCRPSSLIAMANRALIRVGRDPLPLDLTTGGLIAVVGTSFGAWALFSGGFTALALALLPADVVLGRALPHVVAAYPLAFAVGFLSLITPSGLGVREGMLIALLSPSVGSANAVVVAIGMRAWEVLLDAVAGAIAFARLGLTRAMP